MQLNVVLLNSLIKAINHMYDILIIWIEFGMLLFELRSFFFCGVLVFDLFFISNSFCFFFIFFGNLFVINLFTKSTYFFVFLFFLAISANHYISSPSSSLPHS